MIASNLRANWAGGRIASVINGIVAWLDAVPYWFLALPARVAIATVFWNSGTTKLADWTAALALFSDEYQLPLLPPVLAAYLAAAVELTTPPLLILGLLTRPVAALLLGMTAVIEVFVYPLAWPVHIQWAAMLLMLLCRGAGTMSVDHLLHRWWRLDGGNGMGGRTR